MTRQNAKTGTILHSWYIVYVSVVSTIRKLRILEMK